jgi:DNA-binding GntR family transcriptional regulator
MDSLEGHLHWFSVLSTVYKTRPIESNEEHKAILNSILDGDYDKAKELLSIHIIGSQQIQLKEFGNMDENFMTNN